MNIKATYGLQNYKEHIWNIYSRLEYSLLPLFSADPD